MDDLCVRVRDDRMCWPSALLEPCAAAIAEASTRPECGYRGQVIGLCMQVLYKRQNKPNITVVLICVELRDHPNANVMASLVLV